MSLLAASGCALVTLCRMQAAAAVAATPSPAPQQSDPCGGPGRLLATANRPTVGYSACAVKRGTVVFELGYQNEVDGIPDKGAVVSQVPQTFTRVGAGTRFEFDLIGPNYVTVRSYSSGAPGTTQHGVTDSGIGFKYELPPAGRWTIAVDSLYTGPNGSPFLTAGNGTLTGNLDASFALSPAMGVGTTIAISSTGGYAATEHIRYGVTTPSLVVTAQIPHYYQFYGEYVLTTKASPSYGSRDFVDFGVQKLLGSRTEIDVEYGHAFSGDAALKFNYIGSGAVFQLW